METQATILHADLDAFYASVEQLLDPSLQGKPIAVGGGVVLAASYEAKAFGVRGGMSGRKARELCPQLIFVGGHFSEYQRLGDAAIAILGDFTPLVERISIDEAFADVAGCTHLFGAPAEIAATIRRRVRAELGLPISVGVARTKHLAKIASQVAKPDGLVVVDPATELEFLHDLPVGLMWGVGPVTRAKLAEQGIFTIGQLADMPGRSLERLLGHAAGEKLRSLAWNRDPREIPRHAVVERKLAAEGGRFLTPIKKRGLVKKGLPSARALALPPRGGFERPGRRWRSSAPLFFSVPPAMLPGQRDRRRAQKRPGLLRPAHRERRPMSRQSPKDHRRCDLTPGPPRAAWGAEKRERSARPPSAARSGWCRISALPVSPAEDFPWERLAVLLRGPDCQPRCSSIPQARNAVAESA